MDLNLSNPSTSCVSPPFPLPTSPPPARSNHMPIPRLCGLRLAGRRVLGGWDYYCWDYFRDCDWPEFSPRTRSASFHPVSRPLSSMYGCDGGAGACTRSGRLTGGDVFSPNQEILKSWSVPALEVPCALGNGVLNTYPTSRCRRGSLQARLSAQFFMLDPTRLTLASRPTRHSICHHVWKRS